MSNQENVEKLQESSRDNKFTFKFSFNMKENKHSSDFFCACVTVTRHFIGKNKSCYTKTDLIKMLGSYF